MRNLTKQVENRTILYTKLIDYGFKKEGKHYSLKKEIGKGKFQVLVDFCGKHLTSKMIDKETEEEYILVDILESQGSFVGKIRQEYEQVLKDILENCTRKETFKNPQTLEITNYIQKTYHDELEYLWEKFDDTAVVRNKKNQKWYGIFFVLEESKLGLPSHQIVEVIDLRYPKEKIEDVVDNVNIFLGYHMNKKHWISVKLDGHIQTEKIKKLVEQSYLLSCSK